MKDSQGNTLTNKQILRKSYVRGVSIASEAWIFLLHIVGLIPSHHIRRFFYRLSRMKIGKGSSIHMGAKFYNPTKIVIGSDTIIGEGAVLDGRAPLTIGNHVAFATEVMVYNCEHDVNDDNFAPVSAPVVVEDYVFVGPRAVILPGVTVGKGAVVAAGAVVTKDVEPYSIVGGVPAKPIGERKVKDLHYVLGRARWFR